MKHTTTKKIILASQSPRRRYLLEQAGLTFEVIPSEADETHRPDETPKSLVRRLSRDKAVAVAAGRPDDWVLGADTIVVAGDHLLEKPRSRSDARRMLQHLSGNVHQVHTGFTLCCRSLQKTLTRCVTTDVRFKQLSPAEIDWYISTDEPFDKAGAYAIQGLGTFLVRRIKGSYTNVVGLPVCEVIETLIQENVIRSFNIP